MASLSAGTLAAMAVVLTTACATQPPPPPPEKSWDGLDLRRDTTLERVYLRPDATFDHYKRVMLDRVEVSFDKNWDPKKGPVALQDMAPEEIRADVASALREVFQQELESHGYPIVASSDADVLRVRATITDLYVRSPDTNAPGGSGAYAMDATHMTLVAELFDSETGLLLARVYDTAEGTDVGTLQVAHSMKSSVEGRRALTKWAVALRDGLDRAQGKKP
jgi:uncharacterized protein DUF3313